MKTPTPEQSVREKYKNAYAERQRTNGGQTYYIIRADTSRLWLGEGSSRLPLTEHWTGTRWIRFPREASSAEIPQAVRDFDYAALEHATLRAWPAGGSEGVIGADLDAAAARILTGRWLLERVLTGSSEYVPAIFGAVWGQTMSEEPPHEE